MSQLTFKILFYLQKSWEEKTMKRGKDEEKSMGPMFPRLHVNDTEKGGPRAPPRNKMALYEQLSIPSQRFNGPNSNLGTVVRQEQKKKQEEDDFRVPIFDQQSETSQNHGGNHQNRENNLNKSFSGRLAHIQNAKQKVQKENSQDFAKSASNQLTRQNNKGPLKETNESSSFVRRNASNNVNLRDYPQADKTLWGESVVNKGIPVLIQENVFISPNDNINGDAVSETSMVDSICGVDISPDDVVGIIGQKHFWKARRAIVNQQRVFAVQVFELHRLIKVQRLIAGSPHILVEDLEKPAKPSPIKKISFEHVMKSSPVMANKHKDDRETEFSAENAIGKASLSSVQNGSQNPSCRPFSGTNALPFSDPKMGSWSFNHMPGHQWLIPVMSPSEGLVYKPYPGPGFAGPVYGSGPTPVTGPNNFANYGVPPSDHRYEGPTGVHPFAPSPASHGYFPPYNMPTVNPSVPSSKWEQTNPFNQSSNNVPIDKNKFDASKDSEVQVSTARVQVSTASSRSDRTRGRDALNLFPTSPPPAEPTQVIRVVPHNARSATAFVARIFQSIQEERKQYDSG